MSTCDDLEGQKVSEEPEDEELELVLKPVEIENRAAWKLGDDLVYQIAFFAHFVVEHDSCLAGKEEQFYKLLPDVVESLKSGGMTVKKVTFMGLKPHITFHEDWHIRDWEFVDGGIFDDKGFFEDYMNVHDLSMDRLYIGNLDGEVLAASFHTFAAEEVIIELLSLENKSKHSETVMKTVVEHVNACHVEEAQNKVKASVNMEGHRNFEKDFAGIDYTVTYDAPPYPEEVTVKYFVALKRPEIKSAKYVTVTRASYGNYTDEDEKWSSLDLVCQNLKSRAEIEDFLKRIGYEREQEVKERILKEHFE